MGIAREIARLRPNSSGLLPNANIEAMAATKLTGQVPDANAPSGSVLQVVSTSKTDTFSTGNASSYIDITGMSLSITPISTSSRIVIIVSIGVVHTWGSGRERTSAFRVYRNSDVALQAGSSSNRQRALFRTGGNNTDGNHGNGASFTFVDSPNTTSAITYKLSVEVEDGQTMYFNSTFSDSDIADAYGARTVSTITAMEIAA